MFDLDDFKKVNDTRGHLEGDRILMKTAAVVRESLREIDTAARYGGEEFVILLPETSRAGAHVVADRIRRRIEERFRGRDAPQETISGGVATYPEDATSPEDLLRRADEGLYRAKADGKNRITMVGGERRRHLRVSVSHPLLLRARSTRRTARAKNVSAGGLLVSLRGPVTVGSNVTLVIPPAGGTSMALRGVVVRVEKAGHDGGRPYELGVRLAAESTAALRALRRIGPELADQLERRYHILGFPAARVEGAFDRSTGTLSFTVDEGRLGMVAVDGLEGDTEARVPKVLDLRPGKPVKERDVSGALA